MSLISNLSKKLSPVGLKVAGVLAAMVIVAGLGYATRSNVSASPVTPRL